LHAQQNALPVQRARDRDVIQRSQLEPIRSGELIAFKIDVPADLLPLRHHVLASVFPAGGDDQE
jgi:hypothetical protein